MKWRSKKNKSEPVRSLEEQRAEKLAELGSKLRATREEQDLSLEQVAANTKIQRRLLQAIEEANLDELPEPIYIQGFIRQFADELGLNGVEFAKPFPTGTNRLLLKPVWKTLPGGINLRPMHLYLFYVFLIICAVNGLSNVLVRTQLQANFNQGQESLDVEPGVKTNQLFPNQPGKLKAISNNPSGISDDEQSVKIGVSLKESSWIRVVADGKTKFEGVLPEGTQRTWIADEQLTVRAGNAGGVLVTVNQQEAKQMGEPGKVEEVTVAAKSP
jgi:cytoskeletal protein RodZ